MTGCCAAQFGTDGVEDAVWKMRLDDAGVAGRVQFTAEYRVTGCRGSVYRFRVCRHWFQAAAAETAATAVAMESSDRGTA